MAKVQKTLCDAEQGHENEQVLDTLRSSLPCGRWSAGDAPVSGKTPSKHGDHSRPSAPRPPTRRGSTHFPTIAFSSSECLPGESSRAVPGVIRKPREIQNALPVARAFFSPLAGLTSDVDLPTPPRAIPSLRGNLCAHDTPFRSPAKDQAPSSSRSQTCTNGELVPILRTADESWRLWIVCQPFLSVSSPAHQPKQKRHQRQQPKVFRL
jgi:hypothetical protein